MASADLFRCYACQHSADAPTFANRQQLDHHKNRCPNILARVREREVVDAGNEQVQEFEYSIDGDDNILVDRNESDEGDGKEADIEDDGVHEWMRTGTFAVAIKNRTRELSHQLLQRRKAEQGEAQWDKRTQAVRAAAGEIELVELLRDLKANHRQGDKLLKHLHLRYAGAYTLPMQLETLMKRVTTSVANEVIYFPPRLEQFTVSGAPGMYSNSHFTVIRPVCFLRSILGLLLERNKLVSQAPHQLLMQYDARTDAGGRRVYGEANNGDFWMRMEQGIRRDSGNEEACPLMVVMYTDKTQVDDLGKTDVQDVVITLDNLPCDEQMKAVGKQCIGYIPSLSKESLGRALCRRAKGVDARRAYVRDIRQQVWKQFLDGLRWAMSAAIAEGGIVIYVGAGGPENTYRVVPVLARCIVDTEEANHLAGARGSYLSTYPCYKCMLPNALASSSDMTADAMPARTETNMRDLRDKMYATGTEAEKATKALGIYPTYGEGSAFTHLFPYSDTGAYGMLWPDSLHQSQLGLMKHNLEMVPEVLKQHSGLNTPVVRTVRTHL
jgi:hypothetical protein